LMTTHSRISHAMQQLRVKLKEAVVCNFPRTRRTNDERRTDEEREGRERFQSLQVTGKHCTHPLMRSCGDDETKKPRAHKCTSSSAEDFKKKSEQSDRWRKWTKLRPCLSSRPALNSDVLQPVPIDAVKDGAPSANKHTAHASSLP